LAERRVFTPRQEEKMMRIKTGLLGELLVVGALSFSVFAQDNQKVHGYLVDAVCAKNHATEPGYAANHDKKCNLMAVCQKSGYSLITADQKVLKFDAKGAEQALHLIQATEKDKDWKVVVTGKVDGDTIAVMSIALE
jgi:hypothetical protein